MADLYARIVLRLIGPALALRERGLAERLEGLSEAAQGPCVNAVADELLKSAGFGDPMPPKNGGDAEAEGAAQPHKPIPPSPCGSVAALYEAMQQGAADAVAATQRAEEARSKQNAQWDVVREVLGNRFATADHRQAEPASDRVTVRDLEQAGVFAGLETAHRDRPEGGESSGPPAISIPCWFPRPLPAACLPTLLRWIRRLLNPSRAGASK